MKDSNCKATTGLGYSLSVLVCSVKLANILELLKKRIWNNTVFLWGKRNGCERGICMYNSVQETHNGDSNRYVSYVAVHYVTRLIALLNFYWMFRNTTWRHFPKRRLYIVLNRKNQIFFQFFYFFDLSDRTIGRTETTFEKRELPSEYWALAQVFQEFPNPQG